MSTDDQYYTIVESKTHYDRIMMYLGEYNLSFGTKWESINIYDPLIVFYPKNLRHPPLQFGMVSTATDDGYERRDLCMFNVPNELFEM